MGWGKQVAKFCGGGIGKQVGGGSIDALEGGTA